MKTSFRLAGAWALLGAVIFTAGIQQVLAAGSQPGPGGEGIPLTFLHTNDLHSHLRPEKTPLNLGGVARLATLVERTRKEQPNTLFVDGGDFSEGQIYYNLGHGAETMRTMDLMGYDVVLVGNHDWYNGPSRLLDAYLAAAPRFSLLGTNFDATAYDREAEFKRLVSSVVIKEVQGVRIAFIGLATYQFIFDKYLKPVKVTEPFALARELSARLKKQVDLVVAVSHNGISTNEKILQNAPAIDFIIGAHDHVKLTHPKVVKRAGAADGFVVETGCWGRYLGRVDVRFTPGKGMSFEGYRLLAADRRVPEHPAVAAKVEQLERELTAQYGGPIFDDHVAETHIDVDREGQENLMGNLVTDAYKAAVDADFSLDQISLIYGELHQGRLNTADFFNSNPGIYNPATQKSWTLHTLEMNGRTVVSLLNILYSSKLLAQIGIMSTSGMQVTFDPLLRGPELFSTPLDALATLPSSTEDPSGLPKLPIRDVLVNGSKLDLLGRYRVAAGGGIVDAFRILNGFFPGAVNLATLKDTGVEDWRILKDYVRAHSPLTAAHISLGDRVRSVQPDLGVLSTDITARTLKHTADGLLAHITVTVRNNGMSPALEGSVLKILGQTNSSSPEKDPEFVPAAPEFRLPLLANGQTATFEAEAVFPGDKALGLYSVTAQVSAAQGEVNLSNNETTVWLKPSAQ